MKPLLIHQFMDFNFSKGSHLVALFLVTISFLVIISCATYRYPILNALLPIIAFFLVSFTFEYSIYRFRVKNHLKKV